MVANPPLIFIVEDNQANLRLVNDLLKAHGFRVMASSTPDMAMELIKQSKPDLILMDISLKDMSGLDLTRNLQANIQTRQIPVIALTAHTTKQDEINAMIAGCAGFLTKPINTRTFPNQILKYLEKRM